MTSSGVAHARDAEPRAPAANTVLKAGQFHWYAAKADVDAPPATGAIAVVVSIPTQMAYVYRDRMLIGVSSVSTGMSGWDTPSGTYTILQKQVMHRSNLYDDAPMPFMQRLTWDGIALHAGNLPGYPASHGCIRLPAAFAKKLYGMTSVGATVAIVDVPIDDPNDNPWLPETVPTAAPAPVPVTEAAVPAPTKPVAQAVAPAPASGPAATLQPVSLGTGQ